MAFISALSVWLTALISDSAVEVKYSALVCKTPADKVITEINQATGLAVIFVSITAKVCVTLVVQLHEQLHGGHVV